MTTSRLATGTVRTLVPLALLAVAAACGSSTERASDTTAAARAPSAGVAASTSATSPASDNAMVDPDRATREQLLAVNGMTPAAADALMTGRPYADMVAVDRTLAGVVPDSAARRALYVRLWKPIDLNKASDAEILLIPGVGRRMLHEFKEYRPYTDLARFHREIGKYVKPDELARLERYVAVR